MLPVSWQIGCDLFRARAMFWSMIFIALSAMVPFFSFSSEPRIAWCTSSGISVEVRRTSSSKESDNRFIVPKLVTDSHQVNVKRYFWTWERQRLAGERSWVHNNHAG